MIVVEDANDNQPTFPNQELSICEEDGKLGSVVVVAEDPDQSPFSSPFTFTMPKDYEDKWSVTRYNSKRFYFTHLVCKSTFYIDFSMFFMKKPKQSATTTSLMGPSVLLMGAAPK